MPDKCPICLKVPNFITRANDGGDIYIIDCSICGKYRISHTDASTDVEKYIPRYLLSAIIRNKTEQGEKINLSYNTLEQLKDSISEPSDPFDKIDLLLKYIQHKTGKVDNTISFNGDKDYPLLYAQDEKEFCFYVNKSIELKFVEHTREGYRLSLDGWRRLSELKKKERISNQAFVAMWFDKSLDKAWKNGFKPALKKTGFNPIRIDLQEHNEKICDKIIAEIKKSGLVVSDFTGQRGGVYFESGFAMGLGIPIIRSCRSDNVKDLHFDTRQYSHIIWDTPKDLKEKLIHRIEATIINK